MGKGACADEARGRGWARQRAREGGAALIAAIWWSLVIAMIAIAVARETRTALTISLNEVGAAKARAAAEAGVDAMVLALAAEARGLRAPVGAARPSWARAKAAPDRPLLGASAPVGVDGRPYAWALEEFVVTVRAEAEIGKYDLNTGDPALAPLVLAAAGVASDETTLAPILALRRRGLDGRRISWRLDAKGATSIDDVVTKAGLDDREYARIAPFITVASRRIEPAPALAPEALFDALPLSDDARSLALAARREARAPWPANAPLTFTIRARAEAADGGAATAGALVEISPSGGTAIRYLRRDRVTADLAGINQPAPVRY